MSKKYKLSVDVDYVQGHLRYGHLELELSEEEYKEFTTLSDSDKKRMLRDGEMVVDEYEVYDYGDLEMDTLHVEGSIC